MIPSHAALREGKVKEKRRFLTPFFDVKKPPQSIAMTHYSYIREKVFRK
jgi:hypothetical protein